MTTTYPRPVHHYKMAQQLQKGEVAEAHLDRHFAERFIILPADRHQQRQGIDRLFTHRNSGQRFTVEYKTDWTAAKTGNAFVETISVDTAQIPGWAYRSQAEWLIYFVPQSAKLYIVRFADLRDHLPQWVATCPPAPPIPNENYHTLGILVPLALFALAASKIESA